MGLLAFGSAIGDLLAWRAPAVRIAVSTGPTSWPATLLSLAARAFDVPGLTAALFTLR